MKPWTIRIAQLWIKSNQGAPLTDNEMREWNESHKRLQRAPHETAAEVVMAYLWDRSMKDDLCRVEKELLIWALNKNEERYWELCKLQNLASLAHWTGDTAWAREIEERLQRV